MARPRHVLLALLALVPAAPAALPEANVTAAKAASSLVRAATGLAGPNVLLAKATQEASNASAALIIRDKDEFAGVSRSQPSRAGRKPSLDSQMQLAPELPPKAPTPSKAPTPEAKGWNEATAKWAELGFVLAAFFAGLVVMATVGNRLAELPTSEDSVPGLVCQILGPGVPNSLGMLCDCASEIVCALFIADVESYTHVAAIGVGNAMQNCLGMSVGISFTLALDPLVSQAYGAEKHHLSAIYLQRGKLITCCNLLWIVPIQWHSFRILRALKQPEEVSMYASQYNRTSVWGLAGLFLADANGAFLRNRGRAHVKANIQYFLLPVHFLFCYVLISKLRLGNVGSGVANSMKWWLQYALSAAYLVREAANMKLEKSWVIGFQAPAFDWQGWREYLQIAIPVMLAIVPHWWIFEIQAIVSGWLGPAQQAAHVSTFNFWVALNMLSGGLAAAAAALVGEALGQGDPTRAAKLSWTALAVAEALGLAEALVLVAGRHRIAALYFPAGRSAEADACRAWMADVLILMAASTLFSACTDCLAGILRGMNRADKVARTILFSCYVVQLPLSLLLAFPAGLQIYGIYLALVAGSALSAGLFVAELSALDFQALAKEAAERMQRDEAQALKCVAEDGGKPVQIGRAAHDQVVHDDVDPMDL